VALNPRNRVRAPHSEATQHVHGATAHAASRTGAAIPSPGLTDPDDGTARLSGVPWRWRWSTTVSATWESAASSISAWTASLSSSRVRSSPPLATLRPVLSELLFPV